MQTGIDHIAVSIREQKLSNLSLGRAKKGDYVICVTLNPEAEKDLESKILK